MQEQDGTEELQRPMWFICEPVYLQLADETCQKKNNISKSLLLCFGFFLAKV